SHYTNMSVGRALLIADGVVILAAGVAFGPERALYGLLAVFLTMRVVDLLEEGAPDVQAALIVTDVAEEISAKIISDLGRGVTSMPAQGMYTKHDRNLLFVTLYQDQVGTLKQLVHEVDPDAFVVITDVHEALGEGFRSLRCGPGRVTLRRRRGRQRPPSARCTRSVGPPSGARVPNPRGPAPWNNKAPTHRPWPACGRLRIVAALGRTFSGAASPAA